MFFKHCLIMFTCFVVIGIWIMPATSTKELDTLKGSCRYFLKYAGFKDTSHDFLLKSTYLKKEYINKEIEESKLLAVFAIKKETEKSKLLAEFGKIEKILTWLNEDETGDKGDKDKNVAIVDVERSKDETVLKLKEHKLLQLAKKYMDYLEEFTPVTAFCEAKIDENRGYFVHFYRKGNK